MQFSLQLTCRQKNEFYFWRLLTHFITGGPLVLDELGSLRASYDDHTILNAIIHGVESDTSQMELLVSQLTTEAGVLQVNWKPLATAKAGKRTVLSRPNGAIKT